MLTSQTLIIVVLLAMAFVIANLPKKQVTNEEPKDLHKTNGVSLHSSYRRERLREFLRKSQQK